MAKTQKNDWIQENLITTRTKDNNHSSWSQECGFDFFCKNYDKINVMFCQQVKNSHLEGRLTSDILFFLLIKHFDLSEEKHVY